MFTARYGLNDYVLVHSVRKCALVSWLRRLVAGLPPRSLRFDLRSVHVRFVLDRVTLGLFFLTVLRFYSISIIPQMFHIHTSIKDVTGPGNVVGIATGYGDRMVVWAG